MPANRKRGATTTFEEEAITAAVRNSLAAKRQRMSEPLLETEENKENEKSTETKTQPETTPVRPLCPSTGIVVPMDISVDDTTFVEKQAEKSMYAPLEKPPEKAEEVKNNMIKLREYKTNPEDVERGDKYLDLVLTVIDDPTCLRYPEVRHMIPTKNTILKLRKMIGLQDAKVTLCGYLLFVALGLNGDEMNNFACYGEPGAGKTTFATILGDLLSDMGLLPPTAANQQEKVLFVTADSLIGQYLGHSLEKTEKVIQQCIREGKILFLDEVYSLGPPNQDKKGDSFAKSVVDCITGHLSKDRRSFIMIIAGYYQDVQDCFFAYNHGLFRRFDTSFTLPAYSPAELRLIFLQKLEEAGWSLAPLPPRPIVSIDSAASSASSSSSSPTTSGTLSELASKDPKRAERSELRRRQVLERREKLRSAVASVEWFEGHAADFPFGGGDIEVLLKNCKIEHAKQAFGVHRAIAKKITQENLDSAFKAFKANRPQKIHRHSPEMTAEVRAMFH
jgi:hypothetical protein